MARKNTTPEELDAKLAELASSKRIFNGTGPIRVQARGRVFDPPNGWVRCSHTRKLKHEADTIWRCGAYAVFAYVDAGGAPVKLARKVVDKDGSQYWRITECAHVADAFTQAFEGRADKSIKTFTFHVVKDRYGLAQGAQVYEEPDGSTGLLWLSTERRTDPPPEPPPPPVDESIANIRAELAEHPSFELC